MIRRSPEMDQVSPVPLVNFDSATRFGSHRDSGEGGLFVVMVVPEPETWSNNCHVDTTATIRVHRPNVCVTPGDHELWSKYGYSDDNSDHMLFSFLSDLSEGRIEIPSEALSNPWRQKARTGMPYRPWARWVLTAIPEDQLSRSCLAVVHLGSTGGSWYHDEYGFWTATVDDLTPAGITLFNTLEAAFNVTPLILTFLDT